MKPLGLFKELPGSPAGSPLMRPAAGALNERQRGLIGTYLLEGGQVRFTMERMPDVLDGDEVFLTAGLRTDGVWFWRSDLAHYVLKYGPALPDDFLDHAAANGWTPPALAEEELARIARQLREEGW